MHITSSHTNLNLNWKSKETIEKTKKIVFHTVPILWRLFSRIIETMMKTVQTQPTAHVGVWSRSLEFSLSSLEEAIATLPLYSHANKTRHKNNLCLYFDININIGETKQRKWWYGVVENEIKIATLCHILLMGWFWKLKIENWKWYVFFFWKMKMVCLKARYFVLN